MENQTDVQEQAQPQEQPKPLKCSVEHAQEVFDSLGLRYTLKAFRYCAEHNLALTDLMTFSPKNHLDLVLLGTSKMKPEEADNAITKWLEETELDMPALHVFCLEAAKDSGFFLKEDSLATLTEMTQNKEGSMQLALPVIAQSVQSLVQLMGTLG